VTGISCSCDWWYCMWQYGCDVYRGGIILAWRDGLLSIGDVTVASICGGMAAAHCVDIERSWRGLYRELTVKPDGNIWCDVYHSWYRWNVKVSLTQLLPLWSHSSLYLLLTVWWRWRKVLWYQWSVSIWRYDDLCGIVEKVHCDGSIWWLTLCAANRLILAINIMMSGNIAVMIHCQKWHLLAGRDGDLRIPVSTDCWCVCGNIRRRNSCMQCWPASSNGRSWHKALNRKRHPRLVTISLAAMTEKQWNKAWPIISIVCGWL